MEKFNAAATPLEGTNLIEASAGTGKTFTISMIYLRLLVENGLRIDQVLVVTFTLPATMELRLRIRGVIGEALRFCETGGAKEQIIAGIMEKHKDDTSVKQRLRSALKSFDEASVYTIHSFCQQVLADNAFESGALFSSDIVTDDTIEQRLAADFWRKNVYSLPDEIVNYVLKNTSPAEFLKLYKKRPLSPHLRIEPQCKAPDVDYIISLTGPVREAYKYFCASWKTERESAIEIFNKPDSLNGSVYRTDYLRGRIEAVDGYVTEGDCFAYPDQLVYFTSGKLGTSTKKGCETPQHPLFDAAQRLYDAIDVYDSAYREFLNSLRIDMFRFMDDEGEKRKVDSGMRGFDDLIKDVESALKRESGSILAGSVGSRYKAALIDEFQDTDDLQFEIFSRIFGSGKSILFLIGDPKQAIYRFRGADIFSYIRASGIVKNKFTLANNFRSTPELIKSVNAIFSGNSMPFLFEEIGFTPVEPGRAGQGEYIYKTGEKIKAMSIGLADYGIANSGGDDNDSIILRQLSGEISEITGSGRYKFMPAGREVAPSDIAVLVRSHAHAAAVQESLARYGIPSVSRGHESVLSTSEAAELCRIISAVAEPGRSSRIRSAAATSIIGYDAAMLYRLNAEPGEAATLLEDITERFHGYRETWLKSGFMDMFTLLLSNENITVTILGRSRGERIMANINHVAEVLNMVQFENSFSPDELAAWLENAVLNPPVGDEYNLRLDKDSDAVNIVTMHACKGLEFPVVYCPYLTYAWQPPGETVVYHEHESGNIPVICLDKDSVTEPIKKRKDLEDLAENVRLMYVALTRAKSMCRIIFMMKKDFKNSAPFYLFLKDKVTVKAKVEECYEPFINTLSALASGSEGNIEFAVIKGEAGKIYKPRKQGGIALEHRVFTGDINRAWGMQSYSSIARTAVEEKSDGYSGAAAAEGNGIFAFPRGTKAGLCLHEIFEICDFGEKDRSAVSGTVLSLLRKYGFDDSWEPDVTEMFYNTTGSILPGTGGLTLSQIGSSDRLSEMEFNFALRDFSVSGLREVFHSAPSYGRTIYDRIGTDDTEVSGMMKGFIDLVFRNGDRYYIADWKSNSLGAVSGDYGTARMEGEMMHHNYHLQYYLYTVALHRYLSLRLGDGYSYSRNFGGIFYLFVRGMTGGPDSPGIFHDLPDEETVMRLDRFFRGEPVR